MSDDAATVSKPEVLGYQAVRSAARDYRKYSSDLLGDADIRSYRHLPLEADPPWHTELRGAIQPWFTAGHVAPLTGEFRALARRLIDDLTKRGQGEIGSDLALPYVMGCLGLLYKRPQDVAEWVSWGPNVWLAEAHLKGEEITEDTRRAHRERNYTLKTQRSAKTLDDYVIRVLDEAERKPNTDPDTQDIWDYLTHVTAGGRRLTREELLGIGSVILAGGRDTVVKLITGLVWHLVRSPEDRGYLCTHSEAQRPAIDELARFLSPLAALERLEIDDPDDPDSPRRRVLLSFVSANFDRTVWPDADRVDLHRARKPSLAFGFGRHSCLGLALTQHESLAFLETLLNDWPGWEFDGEPRMGWQTVGEPPNQCEIIDEFQAVRITGVG
jgi:cytochrome P450